MAWLCRLGEDHRCPGEQWGVGDPEAVYVRRQDNFARDRRLERAGQGKGARLGERGRQRGRQRQRKTGRAVGAGVLATGLPTCVETGV